MRYIAFVNNFKEISQRSRSRIHMYVNRINEIKIKSKIFKTTNIEQVIFTDNE